MGRFVALGGVASRALRGVAPGHRGDAEVLLVEILQMRGDVGGGKPAIFELAPIEPAQVFPRRGAQAGDVEQV